MTTVRLSRDLAEQCYSYAEIARMARMARNAGWSGSAAVDDHQIGQQHYTEQPDVGGA